MISTRLPIKKILRERRWTTKVLAEKTGLSESYLTHIKNGTRRWNEDVLLKISEAFELSPAQLLEQSAENYVPSINPSVKTVSSETFQLPAQLDVAIKVVPVIGEIPAQPSEANNRLIQSTTGYENQFVPVVGNFDNNDMFCLTLEDNSLAPHFVKGDYLIICPGLWTNSGDIIAVEYGNEKPVRDIMQINFMEDFIVLESVNHKKAPVAIVRGKDHFRIIGKVVYRYQKMQ